MADPRRRAPDNVPGALFVDDTCIDCDACRWIAPAVFDRRSGQSRVHAQPSTELDRRLALEALVSCPTGSIGDLSHADLEPILAGFPRPITDGVYHCGFHARSSFGAASWLVVRPGGNVLVDSPRFTMPLVRRLEALGGISTMFLTHCDDVADHERFARHFDARRVLMRADVDRRTAGVELQPDGEDPIPLADDLLLIPTPGHTRGSACLLWRDVLLTGDTLAWDPDADAPYAFDDACWYDWGVLLDSLRRLLVHEFAWILPGHGAPGHAPIGEVRRKLVAYLATAS